MLRKSNCLDGTQMLEKPGFDVSWWTQYMAGLLVHKATSHQPNMTGYFWSNPSVSKNSSRILALFPLPQHKTQLTTRHRANVCLMLGQRRRRWPSIKTNIGSMCRVLQGNSGQQWPHLAPSGHWTPPSSSWVYCRVVTISGLCTRAYNNQDNIRNNSPHFKWYNQAIGEFKSRTCHHLYDTYQRWKRKTITCILTANKI